jgi:hypothetical protein
MSRQYGRTEILIGQETFTASASCGLNALFTACK